MSGKNKKHNSIIFLTTLSVYLSLSLLGAAPQVLAYAATTRDFDIQTEIEFKDDFDNQPDNETASAEKEKAASESFFENYTPEIQHFAGKNFAADFIGYSLLEKDSRDYKFSLETSAGNLFFNHSFEFETNATSFFAHNLLSKQKISNSDFEISNSIYGETPLNSENNQIFIVTRLPRAAIYSLIQ